MEVILRRLEQMEKNVVELGHKVDTTLDKFETAEKQRMRRHDALNQLIRAIAEVRQSQKSTGAVLGIFIWVGQSKAMKILGRPTGVVYMGIMGMTRAVWVGQERVRVGHSRL